jgi:hypothetical protein
MVISRPAPLGAVGEPAEELRRVGDLGLGLGDGLAHLQGHDQRQLVGLLGHRLERAAQDLAALARRVGGPLGLDGATGVERRLGVVGRGVGDRGDRLARRGVLDVERGAAGGVAPLAADEQLRGDRVED